MAAGLISAPSASAADLISNGSFENPDVPASAYIYPGTTLDGWTYGGASLVDASSSSAWYGGTAPAGKDGLQFAALQGSSTLSQSFVATAPTVSVNWTNAGRPDFGSYAGNQFYTLRIEGAAVGGAFGTLSGVSFSNQHVTLHGLTPGDTYALSFQGLTATDQTAFIDMVSATAAAYSRPNLLVDGGFESFNIGATNYTYPGMSFGTIAQQPASFGGWTYAGSALVNAQSSNAWYGATAPAGYGDVQFAALQGQGTLTQSFVATSSSLNLSWLSSGRPFFGNYNGDQDYQVLIDGTPVGGATPLLFSTTSGQAFSSQSIRLSGLSAGAHTLSFKGLSNLDETSFLDNVSITAVPEPASWALLMLGFGAIGWTLRGNRRQRRSAVTA